MCRLNFKNLLFTVHVWTKLLGGDRLFPIWNRPILNRQEGVNSIADNFGMCNWRPDSETVASRAFAQTSPITGFLRLALCQYDRVNWGRSWREFVPYDFVFCFSGIWPKRCTIPCLGVNLGFWERLPSRNGWRTMVVTAAVLLSLYPNGWTAN